MSNIVLNLIIIKLNIVSIGAGSLTVKEKMESTKSVQTPAGSVYVHFTLISLKIQFFILWWVNTRAFKALSPCKTIQLGRRASTSAP